MGLDHSGSQPFNYKSGMGLMSSHDMTAVATRKSCLFLEGVERLREIVNHGSYPLHLLTARTHVTIW